MALLPSLPVSETPPLPLLKARKRLSKLERVPQPRKRPIRPPKLIVPKIPKPKGVARKVLSPELVIGMTAAGVSPTRMAHALGVTNSTIQHTLSLEPNAAERILSLREKLKDLKMQKAHQVEGKLWTRLEKEVDEGDAKSVDAMARALLASEKIQAAASGEAHASGAIPVVPTVPDIKILINALLGS